MNHTRLPRPSHRSVRSLWPVGDARGEPLVLGARPWIGEGGQRQEADAGTWFGIVPLLGHSFLCAQGRVAQGHGLYLNGLPVPGGLATVHPGDVVRVVIETTRRQYWLSSEGPASPPIAAAGDEVDAFTLEPLAAGTRAVACDCGSWYHAETWRTLRRCVACGFFEDGEFHALPPDGMETTTP